MKFNATKCYVMSIHRSKKPLTKFYQLNGHILQKVSENPYLGLIIRDDLQWSSHIAKTCPKANSTLGFRSVPIGKTVHFLNDLHFFV